MNGTTIKKGTAPCGVEWTCPVWHVRTASVDGWWIEMVEMEGYVAVSSDSTQLDGATWGLKTEDHPNIYKDYIRLWDLVSMAYFSDLGSARDIAYEAEGDPPVAMWERILHSYGFGKD